MVQVFIIVKKNLDRYVGFFKNRALFFNGKKNFSY